MSERDIHSLQGRREQHLIGHSGGQRFGVRSPSEGDPFACRITKMICPRCRIGNSLQDATKQIQD